jgi:hypothetical protein
MCPLLYRKQHHFRGLFDPEYASKYKSYNIKCEEHFERLMHEFSSVYCRYIFFPSALGINALSAFGKNPLLLTVIVLIPSAMSIMFVIQFEIDKHRIYRKALK